MRRLFIIGAGGFGRETLDWLYHAPPPERDWDEIAGFLDANADALSDVVCTHAVVGDPAHFQPDPLDRLLCCIGHPQRRLAVCAALTMRGGAFTTVIHPLATVSATARIETGCIVSPGANASHNSVLGAHSYLLANAVLAHDAVVGSACNLSPGAVISGHCRIGDTVMLGSNATLLPKADVGDGATIGAGSVVLRRVAAGATVMGVPAKQIAGPGL